MFYLFQKPQTKEYIQLTFDDNQVFSHTKWCHFIPSRLEERKSRASWSTKNEWLSPNFQFKLLAVSNVLITDDVINTHFPEILL